MNGTVDIRLTVNGEAIAESVEPRVTLVDFLRETLGLTGSHVGCEHGVCGACTVRVRQAEAALAAGSIDDAVKVLDLDPPDDIQATGVVKKHLAGVLLRRVAKQLAEPRA